MCQQCLSIDGGTLAGDKLQTYNIPTIKGLLAIVFESCVLFLKTVFCSKRLGQQRQQVKHGKSYLVPIFFYLEKHRKHISLW